MKKMKLMLVLSSMVMVLTLFTSCGKGDDAPATATAAATTCAAGQGYTSYGCMPQGYCPAGSALYNNQCVPVTSGTGSCGGGCPAGQVMLHNPQGGTTCVAKGNCGGECQFFNPYMNQCADATQIWNF